MAEPVFTSIELVGQFDTIDLMAGINYSLVSWAPAVAARERRIIGNISPYTNVVETIVLDIHGETAAEARAALETLNDILEQADAWYLGENVPPVIVRVHMFDSEEAEPLQSVVMGRAEDSPYLLRLQPNFNDQQAVFEIENVEIQFIRRGLWLAPAEERTMVLPKTNPALMTLDMGERLSRLSPTTIRITGFDDSTPMIGSGFLIVTGVSPVSSFGRNIQIYKAADMNGGTAFSTEDDSAHLAHDDDVLQIDAASNQSGTITINNVYAETTRISLFAAVRNNSSSAAWRVRPSSTGFVTTYDRWRLIDPSSQQPRIIFVGTLANQAGAHINLQLEFETDANEGTLDLNYLAVVGHDQNTNYITINGDDYSNAAFPRSLVVADRSLTHRTPLLYIETGEEES